MKLPHSVETKITEQVQKHTLYQQLLQEKEGLERTKQELEAVITMHQDLLDYTWFAKPGHFYSPLIDHQEGSFEHLTDLWNPKLKETALPGINLRTEEQQELLQNLVRHSKELLTYHQRERIRYRFDNDQFGKSDTSFLFVMLRQLKPKQIIEVGSGWSSALMLDVNELYPRDAAQLTLIDPHPERLHSALRADDKKHCTIFEESVQNIALKQFEILQPGDLLFIDDSHVSKSGSDVNYLFFEILPRLQPGVTVHVHDIFYPFEYPYQWVVEDKRNWNEVYLLRALLTGSNMFEILIWPSYLMTLDRPKVEAAVPTATDLGASIWLRKLAN